MIFSCSKDNDQAQPQPETPKETVDVYFLGQEFIANKFIAKYWKNSIATTLNLDSNSSVSVTGMVVSGSDVYVSGSETSSGFTFPCLWKNGVKNVLPAPSPQPTTTGIAISGADVYTAGDYIVNGKHQAVYWKNQTFIELTNGLKSSSSSGIAVSGNNVYVIGTTQAVNNISFISKIWINGQPKIISNLDSRVSSIFIKDNDVYITGKEKNSSGIFEAKYWIYNTLVDTFTKIDLLTSASSTNVEAYSLFLNGTDVYVAGAERDANTWSAFYWKNGQKIVLSDLTANAFLTGINIDGNDIYAFGNDSNKIKVWKNGVAKNYSDGTNLAFTYSIFINKK